MRRSFLVVLALSLLRAPVADAQTATDSAAALRALDAAVRADPTDHSAWHRRGMLAWAMARAHRRVGDGEPEKGSPFLQVAESSLQRAVKLNEREPRYLIELARFRWSSPTSIGRRRAGGMYERARDLARKQQDSPAMAEALAALG